MSIKFEESNTASKTYWVILNRLVYNKTIPAIPPLLIDGSFILYVFASICTPTKNNSVLPPLIHDTNPRINSFHVSDKDILYYQ